MRRTNKIIIVLTLLASAFIVFGLGATYAASCSLTDSRTIKVGETVNVTASINAGAWSLELSRKWKN